MKIRIEKKYTEKLHNCKVDITVYKIDKNEGFGYAAEFKYNNIDYLLTGTMRQQEFDELLKSLFFQNKSRQFFQKYVY